MDGKQWMHALLAAGLAAWAAAAAAQAQAPKAEPAREQVERRLESVKTLIERSSAAKQLEAAGTPEAAQLREDARGLHRQAGEAFAAGDYRKASALLDEAAKKMFTGVRAAEPGQVTGQKKRRDFDNRLESVRALQAALTRVGKEKKADAKVAQVLAKVDGLTQEAVKLADAGEVDKGRALLDQAYLTAKLGVGELRGGDTLVRDLKFGSKEDEYHYEVDRNDTHQMLIKVLLDEKRAAGGLDAMIQGSIDSAAQLRKEAEDAAARRDYDGAVKKLEESTRSLQRAIRGAGVYIPG